MDNKERLVSDSDHHFVFVPPKAIVGSCGSVWASETIKLMHLYPEVYEVCSVGHNYTRPLKQVHARIVDSIRPFMLMTEDKDLLKVSNNLSCRYRAYELQRVEHKQANEYGYASF